MPLIREARVPYVKQNDAGTGAGIRCGAAAIQAILYGRDDGRFNPPPADRLKSDVPVQEDQEDIWSAVKTESARIAADIGAHAGSSEGQQVCQPGPDGAPQCWATHPQVMANLITAGVDTTTPTGRLSGTPATVQLVPEREIVPAVLDSLAQGIGAAVLIEGMHWVVVYKCTRLGVDDFNIFLHDPETEARAVWNGVEALEADVVDIDAAEGSQTVVVGARSGQRGTLRARRRPVDRGLRDRGEATPAVSTLHEALPEGFATILTETTRDEEDLGPLLEGAVPTQVLRVRNLKKPGGSYYLVEFGRLATIVVDGTTHKRRLTVSASEPDQVLPMILSRDQLAREINGKSVEIDGTYITLDKGHFRFEEDLVWERCDQSRSMLAPFYVVRQPRAARSAEDGNSEEDTIYARVDGHVFSKLTRTLRGA